MGVRTSWLWRVPKYELERLIDQAISFADVLRALGYAKGVSGNARILKTRCLEEGIDLSKFSWASYRARRRPRRVGFKKTLTEILVPNSSYKRGDLKKRLIKEGLLEEVCSICGMWPLWCGQRLVLIIDHKNGDCLDNTLSNLRLVCPNCNSQLPTFAGRNQRKVVPQISEVPPSINTVWFQVEASVIVRDEQGLATNHRRVEWLSRDILAGLLWEIPSTQIAKQYGVSDRTIGKWCRAYGLDKPPRGYWAKLKAKKEKSE